MSDSSKQEPDGRLQAALRLTFAYLGDELQLVNRQEILTPLAPSDPLLGDVARSGFWFELQNTDGRTLFRRVLFNPIRFGVEVFSDDPREPIRWQPVAEPQGLFELVVHCFADLQSFGFQICPLLIAHNVFAALESHPHLLPVGKG